MSEGTKRRREGGGELFELPSTAVLAHEIKGPLALIRQLSQLGDDATPREIQQALQRIQLTSERALRLANDLTKTSRLEDGLFELEPVNPTALCDDIAHEMTPLFVARDRAIIVKTKGRVRSTPAVANRDLLRRVIMNLADNALEYSERSTPVTLTVSTHSGGERIRVAVRDYGPTIPLQKWRAVRSGVAGPQMMANRPMSSGLGLYIAQQFAQKMSADLGLVRHRDGVSLYIDLMGSTQLSML